MSLGWFQLEPSELLLLKEDVTESVLDDHFL